MLRYFPILILPYIILLLDIFRYLLKIKKTESEGSPSIFISVVVACRNEQNSLPLLLERLESQNYDRDLFEVIIVDDNSADRTREIALLFPGNMEIRVIGNSGKGKKMALKTGITVARGDLILATDADCLMGKNWIRTIAAFYLKHKPDLIVCPVHLERQPGFFGRFQELEHLSLQAVTAGTVIRKSGTMCNGANLAFTRQEYFRHEKNLRFDIATGDDVFLLHSMKNTNARIMWLESAEAAVETEAAPDVVSFFRQRKRWASKATAYRDTYSILLGIVTFVTNLVQAILTIALIFNPGLFPVFIVTLIGKSIPDFLILRHTAKRYGRARLMRWFIPAQLVYPFYILTVTGFALSGSSGQGAKPPS